MAGSAYFDIFGDNGSVINAFEEWLRSSHWHDVLFHAGEPKPGEMDWYYVHENPPGCFLDVVMIWLIHGNGYRHFPTFETFLLAVIDLVNEWRRWDRYSGEGLDRTTFRDRAFLVPSSRGSAGEDDLYDECGDPKAGVTGVVIKEINGIGRDELASAHPILSRTRWEQNRQEYYSGIDHRPIR